MHELHAANKTWDLIKIFILYNFQINFSLKKKIHTFENSTSIQSDRSFINSINRTLFRNGGHKSKTSISQRVQTLHYTQVRQENFKPLFFSRALSFIHSATIFLFKRRFPGSSAFGFYRIMDVRPLPTSATPSSSRPSILGQDNPGNAENEFVACPRVRVRVRVRADFVTRMSRSGRAETCPFISEVLNGRFFA